MDALSIFRDMNKDYRRLGFLSLGDHQETNKVQYTNLIFYFYTWSLDLIKRHEHRKTVEY